MSNQAVTPWFAPHEKPARIGWYSRCFIRDEEAPRYMNYWDGRKWHYNAPSQQPNTPAKEIGMVCSPNLYWKWRGLAKKPRGHDAASSGKP